MTYSFDAGICAGCSYIWSNLTTLQWNVGTGPVYTTGTAGTYMVTRTDANSCIKRDTATLSVALVPVNTTSPMQKEICSGDSTKIILSSTILNSTFTWTATLTSGNISGFSADSGLVINQVLTNHEQYPGVVIYHITPKTETCTGVTSDFVVTVNPSKTVGISISASANNVCAGIGIDFSASSTNEGNNPEYQWNVNGFKVGTNSPTYNYIPSNGDLVRCILTSSETCTSDNPVTSNVISMVINPNLPVSVSVSASQNPVCSGASVIFTASAENEGSNPQFQWKVNGADAGSNTPVYIYNVVYGDLVWCTLNSSEFCTTGNPATSNKIQMTAIEYLQVSVSINASSNPFCAGSSVTFTAIPSNGGILPHYQWKVNGINAGTNNPVFSFYPIDGDLVSSILTSSEPCTANNPTTSEDILMTADINFPAGVSIAANSNPFCPGTTVSYSASSVNGGSSPSFQWKVNGSNKGTDSHAFSYSPQPGDSLQCILTSNLACVTSNPATSNIIIMASFPVPVVTFTRCFDSITTINAKPFRLKGGIPLGGIYSGPGVNSGTGVFTPSAAGSGTKIITYSYTNSFLCTSSTTLSIINYPLSIFNCGNNLTDIRDNKKYPTVKIGSQCWMASNLNYGVEISASINQRDNCISEKYKPVNGSHQSAVYQWDEIMQYQDIQGSQGLCPPSWHVPTEADWNALFANWTNSAFAGMALIYSGFSGYNALLAAVNHMNSEWNWEDFATFFWSSTPSSPTKAWSHGMNDFDPGVAAYPALRSNAFSARCLKD